MTPIDVVIPTSRSTMLVECLIRSFHKFSAGYDFRFYVVENSSNTADNEYVRGLATSVTVVNNEEDLSYLQYTGSQYNAAGCKIGLAASTSETVLFVHNDVMATRDGWLDDLVTKLKEGHGAGAFLQDKIRINALHVSGLLTTRSLANKVDFRPRTEDGNLMLDVGDEVTEYCRNNNLPVYCHKNTYNNPELSESMPIPFNQLNVARCVNDKGEVVFMHCGRGTTKMRGQYGGSGAHLLEWKHFANNHLNLGVR